MILQNSQIRSEDKSGKSFYYYREIFRMGSHCYFLVLAILMLLAADGAVKIVYKKHHMRRVAL